jgi:hypothetical protein
MGEEESTSPVTACRRCRKQKVSTNHVIGHFDWIFRTKSPVSYSTDAFNIHNKLIPVVLLLLNS